MHIPLWLFILQYLPFSHLGDIQYMNNNVRVYSQLNGNSSLSNCLKIYQGRLIDIAHDQSSVSLTLTEKKPWDFLSIPSVKTTKATVGQIC